MAKGNMCTCDVRNVTKIIQGLIMESGKKNMKIRKPRRKAGMTIALTHFSCAESCIACAHMETHLCLQDLNIWGMRI